MPFEPPAPGMDFPFPDPPPPGEATEIVPGVLWLRFALPFLLDHVNVYLIEEADGWAAFDTGLGTQATRVAWEQVLAGPLRGRRLTRVICSHFHPDHVGQVGWLTQRFEAPLWMPRTELLMTRLLEARVPSSRAAFYAAHGLAIEAGLRVAGEGHGYLDMITGLPTEYRRLAAGQSIELGDRRFDVFTGGGHAPEQAMLHCPQARIFLAADQVLARISPNISVHPMEPEADPLAEYLASLAALARQVPDDVLVLPGHHLPFRGLHARLAELSAHHAARCALIAEATRHAPRSAAELMGVLFRRQMDPHQTGFAFGETLAHVNAMRGSGELVQERGADGIFRVRAA